MCCFNPPTLQCGVFSRSHITKEALIRKLASKGNQLWVQNRKGDGRLSAEQQKKQPCNSRVEMVYAEDVYEMSSSLRRRMAHLVCSYPPPRAKAERATSNGLTSQCGHLSVACGFLHLIHLRFPPTRLPLPAEKHFTLSLLPVDMFYSCHRDGWLAN